MSACYAHRILRNATCARISVALVFAYEQRTGSILADRDLMALRRRASRIEPIDDCPDVFDFPRDIQPILNRLCVDCHGYRRT